MGNGGARRIASHDASPYRSSVEAERGRGSKDSAVGDAQKKKRKEKPVPRSSRDTGGKGGAPSPQVISSAQGSRSQRELGQGAAWSSQQQQLSSTGGSHAEAADS